MNTPALELGKGIFRRPDEGNRAIAAELGTTRGVAGNDALSDFCKKGNMIYEPILSKKSWFK